jgi:hypothetical protein
MTVSEPQPDESKSTHRWYQDSLWWLFIATAVLVFLLGLGMAVHFRTHLVIRYMMWRGNLTDVKAIPASPMPDAREPKDWVRCRFGSLQFNLPPKMAGSVETPKNGAPYRAFRDGSKSVIVALPEGTADTEKWLQTELKLPPQGRGMSRPRLRLALCQASSADFRWSMSQEEVRWHAWCIAMNAFGRLQPDGWAETMFGADLDGILLIRQNRKHACFDWQANRKAIGGFIHFRDDSSEPDPEWMRCVCKSVQLCEEPHSGKPSEKK